jgi:predicted dehydrogenase
VTRVALIGLGYWGPNYARVLNELEEAELVWACDVDEAALDLVRDRYSTVRTTTDLGEILSDSAVDAVIVSTPASTHAALSLAALSAGKHVLCEKPLAASTSECDEVIAVAEDKGCIVMAGHTFIFNPAVQRIQELISSDAIGRVLYCHAARTALGPIRKDVNALWDLASHDVSILLYLLGSEPVEVAAHGGSYLRDDTEDVVFLSLRFEDSVLANVHVSWLDPYKVRKVTVIGERRMVVFDDVSSDEKLRLFDKSASYDAPAVEARGADYGEYKAIVRDGDILIPKVPATEPLKEQVRHFLHCCREGVQPLTDAVFARRVVAVLEAGSESLQKRGGVIELPGSSHRRRGPADVAGVT